jgi:hypothetical protein
MGLGVCGLRTANHAGARETSDNSGRIGMVLRGTCGIASAP